MEGDGGILGGAIHSVGGIANGDMHNLHAITPGVKKKSRTSKGALRGHLGRLESQCRYPHPRRSTSQWPGGCRFTCACLLDGAAGDFENYGIMAWRIGEAVEYGVIDNTTPGKTTGRIWLLGRDEPVLLELIGDCWRDLAGARLEFSNPSPSHGSDLANLQPDQIGLVGDITASRKVRIPAGADGMADAWSNCLYVEWFSELNGRVTIEATGFKLRLSPHVWQMDENSEEIQKHSNMQAMRAFLETMMRRYESDAGSRKRRAAGIDREEQEWEELLRESDCVTDAFREAIEKYSDDPDGEAKEAFVMGWDSIGTSFSCDGYGPIDADEETDEGFLANAGHFRGMDEDSDEDDFFEDEQDPLICEATELCMRAMDLLGNDFHRGSPAERLGASLLEVSGKLAGALHTFYGSPAESGYVMAILKRCLGYLNDGIGACRELAEAESDSDHRMALIHVMEDMFKIRDAIVSRRRKIRGES